MTPIVEGLRPSGGPVDELVDDHDVARLNLLPQGAAGGGHQDVRAALLLQGPHVRLVVDVGRHDGVLPPVPCKEDAINILYLPQN